MNKHSKLLLILVGFSLFVGLSLWVKHVIDNSQYETAKTYNTAVQATETEVFNYAIDSRQGNVLGSGTFEAVNPVSYDEITGKYYQVEKVKERYTQHTETYQCGTTENPRTCTRTYYSWDYAESEDRVSDKVLLHGREYQSYLFEVKKNKRLDCIEITKNCKYGYSYEDAGFFQSVGDIRYYYNTTGPTFWGTILFSTKNGTIEQTANALIVVDHRSIPEILEDVNNPMAGTVTFWVFTIIGLIVTGVLIQKNFVESY